MPGPAVSKQVAGNNGYSWKENKVSFVRIDFYLRATDPAHTL